MNIKDMLYFLGKMFEGGLYKWLAGILAGIIAYLFPTETLQKLAISTGVAVILDTFTAIIAQLSVGAKISSAKMMRLFSKVAGYASALLLVASIRYAFPELGLVDMGLMGGLLTFIFLTESVSILENLNTMNIKLPLGFSKRLKAIFETKTNESEYHSNEGAIK